MGDAIRDVIKAPAGLAPADDVRQAISKLTSLRDGDIGVVEAVACGQRAVPALRAVLFAREPSGLYEARRHAVEALAALHAHDVLIDYLKSSRDTADPVELTGEEAVTNAACRALAGSRDPAVLPLLLTLAQRRPLAGVIEALGKRRCAQALPFFIEALAEDFVRPAAEAAIRDLGPSARADLLEVAASRPTTDGPEPASRRRQRRSALGLLATLGPPEPEDWPTLHALTGDDDPELAAVACRLCLASDEERIRDAAATRLIALLSSANWILMTEIEDWLVRHFDRAEAFVDAALRRGDAGADFATPAARVLRALRRIAARADSRRRARH